MLNQIVESLKKRSDIAGWTVRHVQSREIQVYAVQEGIESQRTVESEKYLIDVLCNTSMADGSPAVGNGDAAVLPGDDIERAIDQATLVAGLVANPVYALPAPAPLPEVPLCDAKLQADPSSTMREVMDRIRLAAGTSSEVHLTAAECFGEITNTHLVNHHGIDADQISTKIDIEYVLLSGTEDHRSETFQAMSRRRVADLDIEADIAKRVRFTTDTLDAGAPPSWMGPVILRDDALAVFLAGDNLNGSVIQSLASASSKYAQFSPWEIGKPVFRTEVKGDSLTVWANRALAFGTGSNRFDSEGIPAGRVQLIRENKLSTFSASQRYAEYLKIPPTGAFGNIELPAGTTASAELLTEPYVEIIQFSWFNPDTITGDFATEVRLGYWVENGQRKPFKGGQLVGNYMDALANVRWSAETGFFGAYLGPRTARFDELRLAGPEEE